MPLRGTADDDHPPRVSPHWSEVSSTTVSLSRRASIIAMAVVLAMASVAFADQADAAESPSLATETGWSDSRSFGGTLTGASTERLFTPNTTYSAYWVATSANPRAVTPSDVLTISVRGDGATQLTPRLIGPAKAAFGSKRLSSFPANIQDGWLTFDIPVSEFGAITDVYGVQLQDRTGAVAASYTVRVVRFSSATSSKSDLAENHSTSPGLYVAANPGAAAARATLVSAGRLAEAAQIDRIISQPVAVWLGEWNTSVRADVSAVASAAASSGRIPQFVLYGIPGRDCGSYSSGGLATGQAYRSWVDEVRTGLGSVSAIVIVEPDALAQLGCLSSAGVSERVSLIAYAAQALAAQGSKVYVDAGNSGWANVATIATRLRSVGVGSTIGFSLNVSNYFSTAAETAYGKQVSDSVGGSPHYVIDTSRNGSSVVASTWCNPSGQRLGAQPTLLSGGLVDAYLWIKRPGESDGVCNGGPAAGTFWVNGALQLTAG